MSAEEADSDPLRGWRNNPGIIAGGLSIAFIAMRLLSISGGDPETAFAILQAQGTAAVIVGTIIPIIGLLAAPLTVFLLLREVSYMPKDDYFEKSTTVYTMGVIVGLGLLSFFTSPVIFTVIAMGTSLVLSGALTLARVGLGKSRSRKRPFWSTRTQKEAAVVYFLLLLIVTVITSDPWLPAEKFSVRGAKPFTGYLLEQSNGSLTVLTSNPIRVIHLEYHEVVAIGECQTSDYFLNEETAWGLVNNAHPYQICPPIGSPPYRPSSSVFR